jgi:hypothetical protein
MARQPLERRQTWTLGSFVVAGLFMQPTLAPLRQHHAAGCLTPPDEPFLPAIRLRPNFPGKDEVEFDAVRIVLAEVFPVIAA